ncbi:L,D-transpeptidase family protein [Ilumatobacter sp.]|uniref:L,D-transpeptidase family protein n=1 Tax=Ilumatobacter sp. TaxID=1967498 RepID=UPI003AF6078B
MSVIAIGALVIGVDALSGGQSGDAAPPPPTVAALVRPEAAAAPDAAAPDVVASEVAIEGCMLDVLGVKVGDTGPAVDCTQRALAVTGYYDGPIDGVFSAELADAASKFQALNGLYVDGIVGRRTAAALGIWPGDDAFIVRTPEPPPGTFDSMGIELSPVASTGADAPPLPDGADQASGKRIVYDRGSQRVWAIDDDENIVRSYLVSGSQFANEKAGVFSVYSKSDVATGWNFEADLPLMVRYQKTDRGNIGFHQIPIKKADGSTYQTIDQLGERLSGGCQRQHPLDAQFMWYFANVGTTVVVT